MLHTIGYVFRKTEDNRKIVTERPEGLAARARFLRDIKRYRDDGCQIVYLDETWVNQNHCRSRAWFPSDNLLKVSDVPIGLPKLPNIPPGKGKRIVILCAGSSKLGFIPGTDMVFIGMHDEYGDYHKEMNTKLFLPWFGDLVRVLEEPSVIVLDNASYHNCLTEETKAPNFSVRKEVLRQWLKSHNIPYEGQHTKAELYEIIKSHKPQKEYLTDVVASEAGHLVLRTPPRQCDLNPIELVWAQVKGRIAEQNSGMKVSDVLQLTKDVISQVTQEAWEKVVNHTIDVENRYWQCDGLREEIEPVIVHLDSDDEEDVTDEDSESSDIGSDAESDKNEGVPSCNNLPSIDFYTVERQEALLDFNDSEWKWPPRWTQKELAEMVVST